MAICKIECLLLRQFSVVFNETTATAAARSNGATPSVFPLDLVFFHFI